MQNQQGDNGFVHAGIIGDRPARPRLPRDEKPKAKHQRHESWKHSSSLRRANVGLVVPLYPTNTSSPFMPFPFVFGKIFGRFASLQFDFISVSLQVVLVWG